jgi:hypothetical protein
MSMQPAATHPISVTTHDPKESHVSYLSIESLAIAHQDDLAAQAGHRRLERLAESARTTGPTSLARGASAGRAAHPHFAALRLRLGHALVAVGSAIEGSTAEDPIRSH